MRNRQLLRIAVVLCVVLLFLYMFFAWQSEVKAYKDKAAASAVEYQDLLNKFNKLTDELKRKCKVWVWHAVNGCVIQTKKVWVPSVI